MNEAKTQSAFAEPVLKEIWRSFAESELPLRLLMNSYPAFTGVYCVAHRRQTAECVFVYCIWTPIHILLVYFFFK